MARATIGHLSGPDTDADVVRGDAMAETGSQFRRWLLAGAVLAIVVAVGAWLLYAFPGKLSEERQGALAVSSSPPGLEKLRARLWIDQSVVHPGESARLTLRFENGTDAEIKKIEVLNVQEPGFIYQAPAIASAAVAAGKSVESGPIELKPFADSGRYKIAVRYRITDAHDMQREGVIVAGPITIRNDSVERRDLFFRRIPSILTLPLFLAVIGYWLQRRQAVEARRQEIWKTILPNFYALSEQHYLPIVRSLRAVERYRIRDVAHATPDQLRRLLFEFLFLVYRMDIFRKRRGQFFFKSRKGEQVASLAWMILKLGSDEALGATCVEASLEKMTSKITYKQFCFQLATLPPLMELEGKFLAWNRATEPGRNFYSYTDLVVIMQLSVYFEANRPFDRDWYEVAAEFEMKRAEEYMYPSPAATDSDEEKKKKQDRLERLKKAVNSYKSEVTAYLASLPKAES
jgi:hypothetical protein